MGTPFLHEFKRQVSLFFKEKIKTSRLALTDVTTAQLLTEEATNGDLWAPDSRTMGLISRAAFEVDDYWRIVDILHKRLLKFNKRNWRSSYKALILLEHLLTHGPERVAEEFQSDKDTIKEMGSFQYVDEKGFNWGSSVRTKSEIILKLLEDRSLLKEERGRARKLTREIKGFGSFCQRSSSVDGILKESVFEPYVRYNSHFNDHQHCEEEVFASDDGFLIKKTQQTYEGTNAIPEKLAKNPDSLSSVEDGNSMEGDHPFYDNDEHQTRASLLSP